MHQPKQWAGRKKRRVPVNEESFLWQIPQKLLLERKQGGQEKIDNVRHVKVQAGQQVYPSNSTIHICKCNI
jgi:hypothetical protein